MTLLSLFHLDGKFFVKEVTALETESGRILGHHLFRCPEPPRRCPRDVFLRNRDRRNRMSSIPFRMGSVPQRGVFTRLARYSKHYEYVYGMGRENCKLLMKILGRPVYDLGDHGCPHYYLLRAPELYVTCPLDHFCTQTMCLLLHRWFRNPTVGKDEPDCQPLEEPSRIPVDEPESDWDEETVIE